MDMLCSSIHSFVLDALSVTRSERSDVVPVEESSWIVDNISREKETSKYNFKIIPIGSRKNTDLLLDGKEFCYSVKCKFPRTTIWTCTHRSGQYLCRVSIRQDTSDNFEVRGTHIHTADLHKEDKIVIKNKIKLKANENKFQSAKSIMEDVFFTHVNQHKDSKLLSQENVIRLANWVRQKSRPKNPTDPTFEELQEFVPSIFFKGAVSCESNKSAPVRHFHFHDWWSSVSFS